MSCCTKELGSNFISWEQRFPGTTHWNLWWNRVWVGRGVKAFYISGELKTMKCKKQRRTDNWVLGLFKGLFCELPIWPCSARGNIFLRLGLTICTNSEHWYNLYSQWQEFCWTCQWLKWKGFESMGLT